MIYNYKAQPIDTSDNSQRALQDFSDSVKAGLDREHKSVPSRFLYDARGSQLFEDITKLPEYYPTRIEHKILKTYAHDMAHATPAGSVLIEFGSGSSKKTEILLHEFNKLAAYIAIDISPDALSDAGDRLAKIFPNLCMVPLVADFSKPVALPTHTNDREKIGFFPGSTIGNLNPLQATQLLLNISRSLGHGSRLIIGVDLKKDRQTLLRAYNDSKGITAKFNLNLLRRANTELGADFDLAAFKHEAVYDELNGRIDMYLVAQKPQTVHINGNTFQFARNERIHTEHSHKYDLQEFADLALQAGWKTRNVWTDDEKLFSVHELAN